MTQDFEKLGLFYLGRRYDLKQRKAKDELVLYESKDLVTHAVCIGMTGSGKTGLCISLIEEAAIDGIPVIAIDPKGDLSNLLLTFPHLSAEEFRPWVSDDAAQRAGVTSDVFAQQEAAKWTKGLADWGQDAARIERMHESADLRVYTPGSNAGLPVSILNTLSAPTAEILDDEDAFRELVTNTATCILALVGVSGDPLKSREHILISNILNTAWRSGESVTLASLIDSVQKPPFKQIGVLDVESFFPKKARFEFAMSINSLLAAPGFDVWLKGEPLNIGNFFHSQTGKPKVSIFSINHLSDSERMFFVSLLLNQIVAWMRSQSGTTSLRAILYMDEIFGYFPPVANPPSKTPLLTLLKQARAYGLGVLLASQNPVDLDYKGLSNTGTWFIGRLQTERDKMRVLEGLEGAAADSGAHFDSASMSQTLAGLGNRVFLMNNVHEDAPEIFETRWTMSYLRGPLTRAQIKTLMSPYKQPAQTEQPEQSQKSPQSQKPEQSQPSVQSQSPLHAVLPQHKVSAPSETSSTAPSLPRISTQFFIPIRVNFKESESLLYRPAVIAMCSIRFTDAKSKLDLTTNKCLAVLPARDDLPINWSDAFGLKLDASDLDSAPIKSSTPLSFDLPGAAMTDPASYKKWSVELNSWVVSTQKQHLLYSPSAKEYSRVNETERDFRIRLQDQFKRERDEQKQSVQDKYQPKLRALHQKIVAAEQRQARENDELRSHEFDSAISMGATVIGAVMGRKVLSQRTVRQAGSAARQVERANKQRQEVQRAAETLTELNQQFSDLNTEFNLAWSELNAKLVSAADSFELVSFAPKKSGVTIALCTLGWLPYGHQNGEIRPLW